MNFNLLSKKPAALLLLARHSRCLSTVPLSYTKTTAAPSVSANPPLLIVHGLFGSKQNWRAIANQLTRTLNRDTYSVDLRNHGESPHQSPHTYPAMSQDIQQFIQDHQLTKPVLLGHSMGGKVVMQVALERPDLVSQLIVDDIAPVKLRLSHDFDKYVDKLKEIEAAGVKSQKVADEMLCEAEEDLGVRQFLLTNMKRIDGVYRSRVPLDLLRDSLSNVMGWEAEGVYTGPTLFISGKKSPHVRPGVYEEIKKLFPNYELDELDTGHWVHAEKPREFMALVEEFIRRNE
ncbi:alpha/beta fold family hydrolase [Kickxella alabastrina]|uniref:alpha/beta fold family hydrolase n=1 Tax=Kickxella alabastrina TaxID=61397 RepID=UPI00221F6C97|nr:alpha/beta fold family hydrolase [Kickxella alabastrina]KAI7834460.1 alpha/beta fold family hydrolase [Kickxella alabastrina]KAJ1938680.1 hypothetical protein GGF37_004713 [Kickxella alabastrina]